MSDIANREAHRLWPGGAPCGAPGAPGPEPTITPYVTGPRAPRGAVIVLPGGGYGGLADHEGEPVALWLNGAGISAFVLRYRVAPHRHPAPFMDAQRGIRWVRSNAARWSIDPRRIGILGFSAGGHLASTTGTHYDAGRPGHADPVERVSCRPDAMVLCYPVITFGEHGHQGSMLNLLGADPPQELQRSLSNETQVTADTPPAFLWHTADDGGVPVQNSLLMASALARNGVPFALHVFPHGAHGLGLAPGDPVVSAWTGLCVRWLASLGFAAAA